MPTALTTARMNAIVSQDLRDALPPAERAEFERLFLTYYSSDRYEGRAPVYDQDDYDRRVAHQLLLNATELFLRVPETLSWSVEMHLARGTPIPFVFLVPISVFADPETAAFFEAGRKEWFEGAKMDLTRWSCRQLSSCGA